MAQDKTEKPSRRKTYRVTLTRLLYYGAVRKELDLWKIDPASYKWTYPRGGEFVMETANVNAVDVVTETLCKCGDEYKVETIKAAH